MTRKKVKSSGIDVKELLNGAEDYLRTMVDTSIEAAQEEEMAAVPGAEKGRAVVGAARARLRPQCRLRPL